MIQIIGPQLSQWDTGRRISASGSNATHAHLANWGDSHAVIMELVDGEAKIPDYLLQTGKDLNIYLVLDGITQESNIFPVRKRERPEDYVYEDDQRNYIYDLTNRAEEAISAANQAAQEMAPYIVSLHAVVNNEDGSYSVEYVLGEFDWNETVKQIKSGRPVVLQHESGGIYAFYSLAYAQTGECAENFAVFQNCTSDNGQYINGYKIYSDGTVEAIQYAVTPDESLTIPGRAADAFTVGYEIANAKPHVITIQFVQTDNGNGISTFEQKPISFDWDETVAAINNNRIVMAHDSDSNEFYPLVKADFDEGVLQFRSVLPYGDYEHPAMNGVNIQADGTVWNFGCSLAIEDTVNEKLGDIETALDTIIALQDELVGGTT